MQDFEPGILILCWKFEFIQTKLKWMEILWIIFLKFQVLKLNLYQISGKKNVQFTRNKKIKNSKD